MSCSVLRKFLTTTSLVAVAATLAACSGEVERFGSPDFSGYTSNQKNILTNSTRRTVAQAPVPVQQAMPSVPVVRQPVRSMPVYTTPSRAPVALARQTAPLTTNSINRVPVNVQPNYRMPPRVPVQPTYQAMPTYTTPVPARVPVAVQQPRYGYSTRGPGVDNQPTGAIPRSVLNAPAKPIMRFHSLPKPAPRAKVGRGASVMQAVPNAGMQRMPAMVPVPARQVAAAPSVVKKPEKPSIISRFFSLPRNAPKSKNIDYQSTAAIRPPAAIPSYRNARVPVAGQQVASVAPISLRNNANVRTSGRWTSAGGTMVTVRPGDDINSLSRRYGVPAKAIADVNALPGQGFVAPGQQLLIPVYQQANAQQNGAVSGWQRQASLPANGSSAAPIVIRVPKANPLRLQSRTPYGQRIVKMQQAANANNRHVVMPGDSLSGIAGQYNVPLSQLASLNGLNIDSNIRMGQQLRLPVSQMQRPAGGIDYTSTASINRDAYGNHANGQASNALNAGQRALTLGRLPKAKPRSAARQAVFAPQSPAPVVRIRPSGPIRALPKPKSRQKVASLPKKIAQPPVVQSDARPGVPKSVPKTNVSTAPSSSQPKFRWPVRGRIISNYGRKRDGGRNDGINLAVPLGTSVRVAETGTVVYAGGDLEGYGNMVLVQHSNGWVTAYAHNSKVLVTKGQQVRRGQIIAQAGRSGNVSSPQLHFELRIKGDPVDPVPFLVPS